MNILSELRCKFQVIDLNTRFNDFDYYVPLMSLP